MKLKDKETDHLQMYNESIELFAAVDRLPRCACPLVSEDGEVHRLTKKITNDQLYLMRCGGSFREEACEGSYEYSLTFSK